MKIVIVEDDVMQLEGIQRDLNAAFEDLDITPFTSVSEFLEAFPSFEASPPDLFLFDIMLRWKSPGSSAPAPPQEWTADRAGIELIRQTRVSDSLRDVPALAWTVLQPGQLANTLPHRTVLISKEGTPKQLIIAIRSLLLCVGKSPTMRDTTLKELGATADLKPGIFGVSVDLKKLWAVIVERFFT